MITAPTQHGPRRVAILELEWGGHRPFYLRLLVSAAGPNNSTIFGSSELLESTEFKVHFETDAECSQVLTVDLGGASRPRSHKVRDFVQRATAGGSDVLVVPNADNLLPFLLRATLRRRNPLPPLAFLIMRTSAEGGIVSRLKNGAKAAMVRLLLALWGQSTGYFLTDGLHFVRSRPRYSRLQPLADPAYDLPVPDRALAREKFGLHPSCRVVGMFGALTERKQPRLVVRAMAEVADAHFLVGGQSVDGSLESALDEVPSVSERTTWLDQYLPNEDLVAASAACDVIIVGQDTDAPSGILLLAVLAGVPVVAVTSPWIRRVVVGANLGGVSEPRPDHLAEVITTVLTRRETYRAAILAARDNLDPDSLAVLVAPTRE